MRRSTESYSLPNEAGFNAPSGPHTITGFAKEREVLQ